MSEPLVRVYFDFVDPLSYLSSLEPALRAGDRSPDIEWTGFELRPPPAPLTTTDDPVWASRWKTARTLATERGVTLSPPRLMPWTRKAHELHAHAGSQGVADHIRAAIFDSYFGDGLDIGRVDVLVGIAVRFGLDSTETKAVLDVDRYGADVAAVRAEALELGVTDVPTFLSEGRVVRGFPDPSLLGTLLPDR